MNSPLTEAAKKKLNFIKRELATLINLLFGGWKKVWKKH
jgi:hypothetical protein